MLSVILKSSVRGLGKAGEIAKVRPGYARYLLLEGKAVRATSKNMELLSEKLASIEEESKRKLGEAEKVVESLNSECLIIVKQASNDGKLFGSVTVRDVAKLLSELGYSVNPKDVFFGEYIKRTGEYEVSVELHADLVVPLKLFVVGSDAEAEKVRISVAKRKEAASAVAVDDKGSDSDASKEEVDVVPQESTGDSE